jgi:hypothetical protein
MSTEEACINRSELIDAIAKDSRALARGRDPRRELPDHDGRQDPEERRGGRDHRFWQVLYVQAGGADGTQSADRRAGQEQSLKDPEVRRRATSKTAVAGRRK